MEENTTEVSHQFDARVYLDIHMSHQTYVLMSCLLLLYETAVSIGTMIFSGLTLKMFLSPDLEENSIDVSHHIDA